MGLEEASGAVYVADVIAGDVTAPFLVWFVQASLVKYKETLQATTREVEAQGSQFIG